jgi:hypothetical protein
MREKLKKALDLIPEDEQDHLGQYLLDLFAKDESEWEVAFRDSPDKLQKLRAEALEAYHKNETVPLDPDKL